MRLSSSLIFWHKLFPFWRDCFTFWDIIHFFGVAEWVGWAAAIRHLTSTLTLAVLFCCEFLLLLPLLFMPFEKWGQYRAIFL